MDKHDTIIYRESFLPEDYCKTQHRHTMNQSLTVLSIEQYGRSWRFLVGLQYDDELLYLNMEASLATPNITASSNNTATIQDKIKCRSFIKLPKLSSNQCKRLINKLFIEWIIQ